MSDYKEQVRNMTNDELRENILKLNKDQLELVSESSKHNLLSTSVFLKKRAVEIGKDVNIIDSIEYKEIKKYIERLIEISKNLLQGDLTHDTLNELLGMRGKLYEFSNILNGYYIELFYCGDMSEYHIKKIMSNRDYKDSIFRNETINGLIENINGALMEAKEDYHKYVYIISQVILNIPMRLVKENYFNIIKNSIIRNFNKRTRFEVEKKIKEYKRIFDSSIQDGYGTKFDNYFHRVQIFKNENYKDKTFDELIKLVEDKNQLSKEIQDYHNFILELGLTINMLIVILKIGEPYKLEGHEGLIDRWNEILEGNGKNQEKLVEDFYLEIEKIIVAIEKEMYLGIGRIYELSNHALEREGFHYEEVDKELSKARRVLNYYNDIDLTPSQILDGDLEELVSDEYLIQLADSITDYIDRSLKTMGNIERKLRMQKLLSAIELPFSGVDEFVAYVRYALNIRVSSKEEINYIVDYINQLLIEIRGFNK